MTHPSLLDQPLKRLLLSANTRKILVLFTRVFVYHMIDSNTETRVRTAIYLQRGLMSGNPPDHMERGRTDFNTAYKLHIRLEHHNELRLNLSEHTIVAVV